MNMQTLKAGFDYSGSEASFAVINADGQLLFDAVLAVGSRDASVIPNWMRGLLAEHQLTFDSIQEWSVGCGPGSFTGLRISAAFVMGLCMRRRDVRCRSVPTACALATTAGLTVPRVLSLYDGRKNEVLAYGLKRHAHYYLPDDFTAVIATHEQGDAVLANYDAFVVPERDFPVVKSLLPERFHDKISRVAHLSAAAFIQTQPENFDTKLGAPVYLRPAVFVEPKPIRILS